jgi:predicted MFS family arabinose efflux permease
LLVGLSAPKILIWPVASSLILGALFILIEFKAALDPIIPIEVLKSRGILLSCLATLGFMMSRFVVLFYTPVFGLAVRGLSPAAAGSLLLPANIGFALGGVVVGWLHVHHGGSFYV